MGLFDEDISVSEKIEHINKYNVLVEYIGTMTNDDLDEVIIKGYLDKGIYGELKLALQYFITVISSDDDGYVAFGYKTALNAFMDNPGLDKLGRKDELAIINEGTLRGLYNTPGFDRMKQLEHNGRIAEITQSAINKVAEDPENKEYLQTMKSLHSISKENQEKLKDNRDIVIMMVPSEEMFASFEMLLRLADESIVEVKKINPTLGQDMMRRIHGDKFIKEERAIDLYNLSGLQDT